MPSRIHVARLQNLVPIIEDNSKTATVSLLKKISEVWIIRITEIKRVAHLVNSNLIEYYGYTALQTICKRDTETPEDTRTLEELLDELNALVGLETVKAKVNDLIAYQKFKNYVERIIFTLQRILYIWLSLEIPEQERLPLLVLLDIYISR